MSKLNNILSNLGTIADQGVSEGKLDKTRLAKTLVAYLDQAGALPYTDPETIEHAQNILGRLIALYAYFESPVYRDRISLGVLSSPKCLPSLTGSFVVGKEDLSEKAAWYVRDPVFNGFENKTSGTTGSPFSYRIWGDVYPKIERHRHYRMVLNEFGITTPRTLYVESRLAVPYQEVKSGLATIRVAEKKEFQNPFASLVCSHGDESSEYWHIGFDKEAYLYVHDYFRFLIDFIQKNKINVLMGSGGFIELLTTFLIGDDSASFPQLVELISNTGDRVNPETLRFLKDTGVTRAWCDHMRCWDGGASFFTCEKGTYHLQDELAYVFAAPDGRLCSVDFFSYPSPFINYANGDYCTVGSEFRRCECGRWYRDFEFSARRPRQYVNAEGGFYDTDEIVKDVLGKFPLGFFSVQDGSVSIEDSNLDDETKEAIVLEMSKLYIMVHFFTNPMLSKISALSIYDDCDAYCKSYLMACVGVEETPTDPVGVDGQSTSLTYICIPF